MRGLIAYVLSFVLAVSGFVLAEAKGASHDIGIEIVICSGIGMTTLTIGPDGEPIETKEVCPDGDSLFVAAFSAPDLPRPVERLATTLSVAPSVALVSRVELVPSARGPPATV